MPETTLGDILDRAQDFEQRLEAFYADARDRVESDGVRLLTHYLARHRDHLPGALKMCSPDELRRLRDSTVPPECPDLAPADCFNGLTVDAGVSGREFLDTALELVGALVSFYRTLAAQELDGEARALFRSLLRIEEAHVVELTKIRDMDYL